MKYNKLLMVTLFISMSIIIYIEKDFIFNEGKPVYKGTITNIVPNNDFLTEKEYSIATSKGYTFVVEQDDIAAYQKGKCIYVKEVPMTDKDKTYMKILLVLLIMFLSSFFIHMENLD